MKTSHVSIMSSPASPAVTVRLSGCYLPFLFVFKPSAFDNFPRWGYVLSQLVFVGNSVHVVEDFRCRDIILGPIRIRCPCKEVCMSRYIACTAGIPVLKPSSTQPSVFFVYLEIDILQFPRLDLVRKRQSTGTGARYDDFDRTRAKEWCSRKLVGNRMILVGRCSFNGRWLATVAICHSVDVAGAVDIVRKCFVVDISVRSCCTIDCNHVQLGCCVFHHGCRRQQMERNRTNVWRRDRLMPLCLLLAQSRFPNSRESLLLRPERFHSPRIHVVVDAELHPRGL